jgi:hypothetical protein
MEFTMPFDAREFPIETIDPLERMGITPVPEQFVRRYKAAYKKAFIARCNLRNVQWRTIRLTPIHLDESGKRLRRFLVDPIHGGRSISDDRSAAPPELIDLALKVNAEVERAEFSLDYFYTDPVLYVSYRFAGRLRKACLGIWDHGVIQAIAGNPPVMHGDYPAEPLPAMAWIAVTAFIGLAGLMGVSLL